MTIGTYIFFNFGGFIVKPILRQNIVEVYQEFFSYTLYGHLQ